MRSVLVATALLALPTVATAQVGNPATVTPFSFNQATYNQNFDTLANSGTTGSALPTGFQIVENGSSANATYAVGTGSSNGGGSYSFGAAGGADRALGSVGSGSVTSILYGGIFTNALGGTITSLAFTYTGEQWRLGSSTTDGLTFQYLVGATAIGTGTWTTFDPLSFAPVVVDGTSGGSALDGNAAANQRAITGTITGLSLTNGATFGFRWMDVDSVGADDGLAVDDLTIRAATGAVTPAVPEPASWALMLAGFALLGAALRRRRVPRFVRVLA